jgi:hypothetical protein
MELETNWTFEAEEFKKDTTFSYIFHLSVQTGALNE